MGEMVLHVGSGLFFFCRNSVVSLENIKAVPRHIGTRVALQPSLGTARPVAGRTEHGPLEPHPLLFCAQEPNTVATHKARLAAEEPRCQALDWTSVRFVAGPFPGICPGFAAACVPVCKAGLRIRLLLAPMDVRSLFPF